MPGLYDLINDPEVMAYQALKNNPYLADQMRENDKRNYAALIAARKAASMPDFPQMESRGNPQVEWFNRNAQAINQMKDDPALFEEASKLYAQLMDRMAQSNQLTAEQRNNAWNGYQVPPEQTDPSYVPNLQHSNRLSEIERTAQLRDESNQKIFDNKRQVNTGGLGMAPSITQKPLSAETAGKLALVDSARRDIENARRLMFDENGELNRALLAKANVPGTAGIGGDARILRSNIENAVASKLRLETGAAANMGEVRNIADRFMPSIMDTKESAEDKLSRLEQFMTEAGANMRPGGAGATGSWDQQQAAPQYNNINEIKRDLSMNKITPEQAKAAYLMLKGK